MSGSSNFPSWMLPLLLLSLFISFSNSRYTTRTTRTKTRHMCRLHEFQKEVEKLEKDVGNCPKNCSSVPITAEVCQCLNLSVSERERNFTVYFTKGLNLLRGVNITQLNKTLNRSLEVFNKKLPLMEIKSEPFISPRSFYMELKNASQMISTICAQTTSSNH